MLLNLQSGIHFPLIISFLQKMHGRTLLQPPPRDYYYWARRTFSKLGLDFASESNSCSRRFPTVPCSEQNVCMIFSQLSAQLNRIKQNTSNQTTKYVRLKTSSGGIFKPPSIATSWLSTFKHFPTPSYLLSPIYLDWRVTS